MTAKQRPYVPSHARRHSAQIHQLELENADLRRRLSAMVKDLEVANNRLKEVGQWESYIAQAAEELSKRVRIATRKAGPVTGAMMAEKKAAVEMKIKSGRATLYVADRIYSREPSQ